MNDMTEQELVSELGEALRELTKHVEAVEDWMISHGYDESPDREALKYPRAVLSKLRVYINRET